MLKNKEKKHQEDYANNALARIMLIVSVLAFPWKFFNTNKHSSSLQISANEDKHLLVRRTVCWRSRLNKLYPDIKNETFLLQPPPPSANSGRESRSISVSEC